MIRCSELNENWGAWLAGQVWDPVVTGGWEPANIGEYGGQGWWNSSWLAWGQKWWTMYGSKKGDVHLLNESVSKQVDAWGHVLYLIVP